MTRAYISLNGEWTFHGPNGSVEQVNIPHTWNGKDGQDGGNDYWRGTCTYEKNFRQPEFDSEKQRVYLEFQGVNSTADVEINGNLAVHHDGGYSTFRADITEMLQEENRLTVRVDNSTNDRVYPQKADFTFYGGIYRDVALIVVSQNHFDLDYFGGKGIKITPKLEKGCGKIHVETFVTGTGTVEISLLDAKGNQVASGEGQDIILDIPNAHLWNGLEDPYLYRAVARLVKSGEVVDQVEDHFGVRVFEVDPKKGFFLNGRSYPLRGVCRHQDRPGIGNAISQAIHEEDMALIREIGANTIRLAHYQHDQYFYDLCDKYGLIEMCIRDRLYYSSDVAELEGAWTLAQVYANGETFDAAVDAAAFTITFSLDPSELVDQAAYTHNQVYNLTGDLTFGVAAINDALSADGLDGYRGSTSWSDFPQGQVMVEGEFYQQPGPATMRFQDVDAYGLFLNQLAAGAPADVDTTERNLILGLNNQGQLLLGASEEHLERPGEEGDWTYCLIFDKAA